MATFDPSKLEAARQRIKFDPAKLAQAKQGQSILSAPEKSIGESAIENIGQGLGGINYMLGKGLTQAVNVVNPFPSQNTLVQFAKQLKNEYDQGKLSEDLWATAKSFVEPIIRDVGEVAGPILKEGPITGGKQAAENIARRPFDYLMDATMFYNPSRGATIGVTGKMAEATPKISENIINSLIRPKERQFAYGKNPGRGVAQEGIVATSMEDLANKISARKNEIGKQIETNMVNAPKVTVDLRPALEPIDNAIAKAKKYPRENSAVIQRLENFKKDILQEKELPDGSVVYGRDMSKVTPMEAWEIKKDIGSLTKYTGAPSDDAIVNSAKKGLYSGIDKKLDTIVPANKKLNERYADLLGAEVATKHRELIASRNNIISLPELVLGGGAGSLLGGAKGAGAGVGTAILYRIGSSVPAKTALASALAKGVPWAEAVAQAAKLIPSLPKGTTLGGFGGRQASEMGKK